MFKKILGFCNYCNLWFVYPKTRRTNTAYVEENSNYVYCCRLCYIEICDYYEERWEEYYNSR